MDDEVQADDAGDVTEILQALAAGEIDAAQRLAPLVYAELRALAARIMRGGAQTLQPTAVVHEAWMKLGVGASRDWESRAHFMAVAAKAMRQVVVDAARRRRAAKRGGGLRNLTLQEDLQPGTAAARSVDILALDEALETLRGLNRRHADLVEMRFFAGLGVKETAAVLGISVSSAEKDWSMARAWLRRALDAA